MKRIILIFVVFLGVFTQANAGPTNIIVNGDFSGGSAGWTITTPADEWTISDGKLHFNIITPWAAGNPAIPTLTKALVAGKKYLLGFIVTDSSLAVFHMKLGGTIVDVVSGTNVSYTEGNYLEVVCGPSPEDGFEVEFNPSNDASASLDDFVLFEVGGELRGRYGAGGRYGTDGLRSRYK